MPRPSDRRKPTSPNRLLRERMVEEGVVGNALPAGKHDKRRSYRSVTVDMAVSPLGWLFAHGHLSERQFDAGEKLRRDFEYAQMLPSVTMRWDATPAAGRQSGGPDHWEPGERQIAARQRFDAALQAVGRDLNDIAWRVICSAESLPDAERGLGWPARSGKLVLRLALDRLADHYRLP